MAEWEEIKRLAADFQRTQASDTLQRLSERNCIDLVKMLTDRKMIDLIYSRDGKEFITPNHLRKEITDEVYVNGGRIALNDLANILNVDYNHVEFAAKELVVEAPEYQLILGQIIHESYKTTIGKQIQDTMMITGQLSIAEMSKSLDLPSEFLTSIVKELISSSEVMKLDDNTYYTVETIDRYKSIIAGTLSAILRPTSLVSIMKRLSIPEKIFVPIVDGLIKDDRIDATTEGRIFIPAIYAREQNDWINNFYKSNSYIGYDVLSRMDVKQPKAYLRKRYPDGLQLKTCFISPDLVSHVESFIEDAIVSSGWIDLSTMIPTSIEADDIEMMIQEIFKRNEQFPSSCLVLNQVNICSHGFVATCKQSFKESMQNKAQEQLKNGSLVNHFLGANFKKKPARGSEKRQDQQEEAVDLTTTDSHREVELNDSTMSPIPGQDQENDLQSTGKNTSKRDSKKDKREKKIEALDESDDDQGGKKGSKSKKSGGGGSQGREIKQKAVKKKYLAGKGKQNTNNGSDDEQQVSSKASRSTKGRAARRGISPTERESSSVQSSISKSKGGNDDIRRNALKKEPLIFMSTDEIARKIRYGTQNSNEGSDELFESIADLIEDELNSSYGTMAKLILDDYLESLADEPEDDQVTGEEATQTEAVVTE